METQRLADALVVAVEERDCLFVLVRLEEIKRLGCDSSVINLPHSWKRCTALGVAARIGQLSTLDRLIVQLLLLRGARLDSEGQESTRSAALLEGSGSSPTRDAQHLLSLPLEDAADWIDANLGLPPNYETWTGDGPLPLAPASTDQSAHRSSEDAQSFLTTSNPSAVFDPRPISPGPSPLHPSDPLPRVSLYLSNLPARFRTARLVTLFDGIGVQAYDPRILSKKHSRLFAFVEVDRDVVQHCVNQLDWNLVHGSMIRCEVAREQRRKPQPASDAGTSDTKRSRRRRRARTPSPELVAKRRTPSPRASSPILERPLLRYPDRCPQSQSAQTPLETSVTSSLRIGGFPPWYTFTDIRALFNGIGVEIQNEPLGLDKLQTRSIFVDVVTEDVPYCVAALDRKNGGRGSYANFAKLGQLVLASTSRTSLSCPNLHHLALYLPTSFQPRMSVQQYLTDRLVTAVVEQDALYALYWLREMNDAGCDQVDHKHSWRGYSALEAIARTRTLSVIHRLIAELLLLRGAPTRLRKLEGGVNRELRKLLRTWTASRREQAHDAQKLLSMPLDEAADWIDLHLPLPPHHETLTGEKPLLPPPSPLLSASLPEAHLFALAFPKREESSLSPRSVTENIFEPSPPSSPLSSNAGAFASYPASPSPESSFAFDSVPNFLPPTHSHNESEPSLPLLEHENVDPEPRREHNLELSPSDHKSLLDQPLRATLCIAGFPPFLSPRELLSHLDQLLQHVGSTDHSIRDIFYPAAVRAYALVDVAAADADRLVRILDDRPFANRTLTCSLASPARPVRSPPMPLALESSLFDADDDSDDERPARLRFRHSRLSSPPEPFCPADDSPRSRSPSRRTHSDRRSYRARGRRTPSPEDDARGRSRYRSPDRPYRKYYRSKEDEEDQENRRAFERLERWRT
ncbi:hypothetical protein JCM11491_006202 [Sporobolomyces phaffii]